MSMTWVMILGARPSDGSSSSSTRGRATSARAMTSICRSPPDKVAASLRRRSASTLNRSYASASAAARSARRQAMPGQDIMPIRKFSSTVSSAMTPCPSGTCAIPALAMSSGPRPARSAPSSRTRPLRGQHHAADRPEQRRLTRAVGTEYRRDRGRVRRDRDPVQRQHLAVPRHQVLDRERRRAT